jgi:hypothetical protein
MKDTNKWVRFARHGNLALTALVLYVAYFAYRMSSAIGDSYEAGTYGWGHVLVPLLCWLTVGLLSFGFGLGRSWKFLEGYMRDANELIELQQKVIRTQNDTISKATTYLDSVGITAKS